MAEMLASELINSQSHTIKNQKEERISELQSRRWWRHEKDSSRKEAQGRVGSMRERAKVIGSTVQSANLWTVAPYLVRISVAKKDSAYKHSTDARYNGWREIWAKCDFELFDRILTKKFQTAYLLETLDYADSLPMVAMFTKRLSVMAADSISLASAYRYYGDRASVSHRIGVELVKPIISPSLKEILGLNTKGGVL